MFIIKWWAVAASGGVCRRSHRLRRACIATRKASRHLGISAPLDDLSAR